MKKKKIIIIDYGMGNVGSIKNAIYTLGYDASISNEKKDIEGATHIILPGVGAFGDGMKNLSSFGLESDLTEEVLVKKKPFLGICLGMQMLLDRGEEGGDYRGIGWIRGVTKRLQYVDEAKSRLPHIGWNDVSPQTDSVLFKGIKRPIFYFVHSYHVVPDDNSIVSAYTEYGEKFASAIEKDNIFGVQFHPEKSQQEGLKVLENFILYNV